MDDDAAAAAPPEPAAAMQQNAEPANCLENINRSTEMSRGINLNNKDVHSFHVYDVCKDAINATPSIIPPGTSSFNLFTLCMEIIFGTQLKTLKPTDWVCGGGGKNLAFGTALHQIETNLETKLKQDTSSIVKQINQLESPKGYGQSTNNDIYLPTNITKAIRDSGTGPKKFNRDISILYNPSDITDPSSRTQYMNPGETFEMYPEANSEFIVTKEDFAKLLPTGIIDYFKAIMYDAKTDVEKVAYIEFKIIVKRVAKDGVPALNVEQIYSTRILRNLQKDGAYRLPVSHRDAFIFFNSVVGPEQSGNPKKNNFFNNKNNIRNYSRENILDGIAYILSKEFFGDIMIGLVALHYKKCSIGTAAQANDYAVFTGDNALTAFCRNNKVNHVSKNHLSKRADKPLAITLEATVSVYNTDPEYIRNELRTNKSKLINDIKRINQNVIDSIKYVIDKQNGTEIYTGASKIAFAKLNLNIKTFLQLISAEIVKVNGRVTLLPPDNNEINYETFYKNTIVYKVKDIIQSTTDGKISFNRSVSNPFSLVPGCEKITIRTELYKYLPTITEVRWKAMGFSQDALYAGEGGVRSKSIIKSIQRGRRPARSLLSYSVFPSSVSLRRDEIIDAAKSNLIEKKKEQDIIKEKERIINNIDNEPSNELKNLIFKALKLIDRPRPHAVKLHNYETKDNLYKLFEYDVNEYDIESLYSYLFFLFDINCSISYDIDVIKILIEDIIDERIQSYSRDDWLTYYAHIQVNGSRPNITEKYRLKELEAHTASQDRFKKLQQAKSEALQQRRTRFAEMRGLPNRNRSRNRKNNKSKLIITGSQIRDKSVAPSPTASLPEANARAPPPSPIRSFNPIFTYASPYVFGAPPQLPETILKPSAKRPSKLLGATNSGSNSNGKLSQPLTLSQPPILSQPPNLSQQQPVITKSFSFASLPGSLFSSPGRRYGGRRTRKNKKSKKSRRARTRK